MDAQTFAIKLIEAAPSDEALHKIGLSEEAIEKERISYQPVPKIQVDQLSGDPLIDLIVHFDLSNVEIGMIRFENQIRKEVNRWIIGAVETDHLVLDLHTRGIRVDDFRTGSLLWDCARDSSRFLDALVLAAQFLAKCMIDESVYADSNASNRTACACAEAAGERRIYRSFECCSVVCRGGTSMKPTAHVKALWEATLFYCGS
jgi:hypothetical protein